MHPFDSPMFKAAQLPGERSGERDPTLERMWGMPGLMSAAGALVDAETVSQLDIVQGSLEALASPISTMPFMVFERVPGENPDQSDAGKQPAPDHPLYRLLHDAPNDHQTAQEFRDELTRHLAFYRNFYAEIIPGDDYAIGALETLHPSRCIKVERIGARVFYTFRDLTGGGQKTYRDDQIWHIRKPPLTRDGLRGVPVFESSKELFGKIIAVENFGARFFQNGTNGGILELPGMFRDKEEQEAFIAAWRESGGGINRHKDRLLLNGAKYNWDENNNEKSQLIDILKQMEVKACRIWNMPPHRVGILERATFSNIEQQSVEFVVYTLAPYIAGLEQSAERSLLVGDNEAGRYFVELNVTGLLRGDIQTRYAAFAQARQWGWLSVNDILRMENLKGIGPKGDVYLEPQNMKPAGEPNPPPPAQTQREPRK